MQKEHAAHAAEAHVAFMPAGPSSALVLHSFKHAGVFSGSSCGACTRTAARMDAQLLTSLTMILTKRDGVVDARNARALCTRPTFPLNCPCHCASPSACCFVPTAKCVTALLPLWTNENEPFYSHRIMEDGTRGGGRRGQKWRRVSTREAEQPTTPVFSQHGKGQRSIP